jgi:NitT/TauT family transport system ATP-binding protein
MIKEPHLRIDDVSKVFSAGNEQLLALDDVTLEVDGGEFICLLGPSGCGKTTLIRIIGGLLEPTSGRVSIGGLSPTDAQRDKALGFVFQEPSLLPWRTVMDNIRLPLQVNRNPQHDGRYSVEELVRLVGLERFGHYYPFQLSGGMQQRVALARALVIDPFLLLMDEPFGALDEITRAAMRYELLHIWDMDKKTVIFVTHSITEAIILSDRVVVLSPQPGHVQGVVDIRLPRPRSEALERHADFLHYSAQLHGLLAEGGVHGAAVAQ